jgi:hypothetical protein
LFICSEDFEDFLSESGFPGCCCLFDVGILRIFLSESGFPGLEDFQDVVVDLMW